MKYSIKILCTYLIENNIQYGYVLTRVFIFILIMNKVTKYINEYPLLTGFGVFVLTA